LKGVDAVVSALNGPALGAQATIQNAADDAGVQRFYHIYRKLDDLMGYV
jgi:hypothetical protein